MLVGVADDVAAVLGVGPGVVAELRVDREVEPLRIEIEVRVVVLLADDEPVDAVAELGIQLRDHLGSRAVGGDDVLGAVDDLLAVLPTRRALTTTSFAPVSMSRNSVRSWTSARLSFTTWWSACLR